MYLPFSVSIGKGRKNDKETGLGNDETIVFERGLFYNKMKSKQDCLILEGAYLKWHR